MKAFWLSLFGFILLMCSCRTQKVDSSVKVREQVKSEVSVLNISTKIDTTSVQRIFTDKSRLSIKERVIITEYDKDTGAVAKKTETERTITQDTDQVATEEESQSVTNCNGLEINQVVDTDKNLDSESKEESIGGQESFGKYFGIGLACVIGIFFIYLLKKLRVN